MHSTWYLIAAALAEELQDLATEQEAAFLLNPPLPVDMTGRGELALIFMQRGDKLVDQPGQRKEKRRMRVVVGAVALTRTGLADADALHFAARDALKSEPMRAALRAAVSDLGAMREVELEPELKDVATEGTLLLSAYEIDYFQTYPNAA